MPSNNFNILGLTQEEVLRSRAAYGANSISFKKESGFLKVVKNLAKEPMVVLLLAASLIYFLSGDTGDGIFLASAIILVSAISLYQDSRSRNALEKLKTFTLPKCKVIRDGIEKTIKTEELVVGDSLVVEEGAYVAADGVIAHSNDFSVNESILTGESLPVFKDPAQPDHFIYQGATVASGLAIATVAAIGGQTKLAKIGKSLDDIAEEKTPLEVQINRFVKTMAAVGAAVFLVVWALNYLRTFTVLDSLLKALTLAMSILPEEIPVAFTTFMALGAWRLMKSGILVKQMKTVETLGSASVICTDKTGTITENKMSLAKIFALGAERSASPDDDLTGPEKDLVRIAMWASEPIPFDPMEVALHEAYAQILPADERPHYLMVHEYPLGGKPPMMTHLFENVAGKRIVAAKGAPEALMNVSSLTAVEKRRIEDALQTFASGGYRVLGVGESGFAGDDFPERQQDFAFQFKGLVAFYDPPKKNIEAVFRDFYAAGVAVKIVTGDYAATTVAIARQIHFKGYEKSIDGDDLMLLSEGALRKCVADVQIFTRMFPEAKLKIIEALKAENEIVAMVGDGVNDGAALKSAHIGVAMGKKGTEIAKDAASMILLEDDLSKMAEAIGMGRRIYANLKKAIRYIISIHIPIILTVFIPLALGWAYPNIFSPVHIIFLELIMGPTCSIIYENEPMEKNAMRQKPRPFTSAFFNWNELAISALQGLVITTGTLLIYQYAVCRGFSEPLTRTMVFTVLIAANIFLTLINRSFYYSILDSIRYKNNLVFPMIGVTIVITGALFYVQPLTSFFRFESLNLSQLFISMGVGFVSVIWFEALKWRWRFNDSNDPKRRQQSVAT